MCDYSMKLIWGGRPTKKRKTVAGAGMMTFGDDTEAAGPEVATTPCVMPGPPSTMSTDNGSPVQAAPGQGPVEVKSFIQYWSPESTMTSGFGPDAISPLSQPDLAHRMPDGSVRQTQTQMPHVKIEDSTGQSFSVSSEPSVSAAGSWQVMTADGNVHDHTTANGTLLQRNLPDPSVLDMLDKLLEEGDQYFGDYLAAETAFKQERYVTPYYRRALLAAGSSTSWSPTTSSSAAAMHSPRGSESSEDTESRPDIEEIPRSLTPLPDLLINVPAYRELFNHFVLITADALVPVPRLYSQNPFKVLLPSMAMATPHLMSLIIAYGATHRAKIMGVPEPDDLIRVLLARTFDGLSRSLEDTSEAKSDRTLAAALLLSSYAIISTTADGPRSWKMHLQGAREIIAARGISRLLGSAVSAETGVYGPHPVRATSPNSFESSALDPNTPMSKELWFLIKVFAYIEIIGALSSSTATSMLTDDASAHIDQLLTREDWRNAQKSLDIEYMDSMGQIDYLLGMDLQMIPMFAKVAALVRRRVDVEKKRFGAGPDDLRLPQLDAEASAILRDGMDLSKVIIGYCSNEEARCQAMRAGVFEPLGDDTSVHRTQLSTMNLLFAYAVLVHLYRRVLTLDATSESVQEVVQMMTRLLRENIPVGSSIEACLSFPIFTAGCEAVDEETRQYYRTRLNGMLRFGLGQVERAKAVMEECWANNVPWTEIVDDLGHALVLA